MKMIDDIEVQYQKGIEKVWKVVFENVW